MKCQKNGCEKEIGGRFDIVEMTHTYENERYKKIRMVAEKNTFHLCRTHAFEAMNEIEDNILREV